ncbi:MAG: MBOAT family protein [Prevotellaceae bacterium]|nr:MBOAT family protein [Candidatus Minthosoma caballi]
MFDIDFQRVIDQFIYQPDSPMIFISGIFLFLFLGFSLIYSLLGKADTLRILFVTLFSYFFYYKSSGLFFVLLALVTITDYFIAKALSGVGKGALGKTLVLLSLVLDLGLLVFFKYTNFLGETICTILSSYGFHVPPAITGSYLQGVAWQPRDIFLPVGISFFTFQSLSYTIDVYRGNIKPLSRLLDYAFYVSFFPQLVAGPIVRARDFIPQIRRPLHISNEMFGSGVFFIMAGLFKKAVISDYISVNFVERVFDQPDLYSGVENLLAVYGYTLQIYCDFSGYSDMAIGIALLLGFQFPKNFDSPYKSASITEFWRRWHISLSSWLKDYLYISMGGNRHGKFRQYFNLLMTMLLGGLWHGASLNFILWGGLHGLFLCIDKIWHSICPAASPLTYLPGKKSVSDNINHNRKFPLLLLTALSTLITFHLVAACWVLFRAQSFGIANQVFTQILTQFQPQVFMQWVESYWAVATLMLLGYVLHLLPDSWTDKSRSLIIKMPLLLKALILIILIFIVIQIKSSDVQPFIYFQF